MFPRPPSTPNTSDLAKLKWRGVWLPVIAIGLLVILVESVLSSLDLPSRYTVVAHLVLLGLIAGGAYGFSGYIFEILRQKEEMILRKHQELSALGRRFRALIEHSADGIVLLNANGFYTYASPSTTRLLGYAAEELVGRSAFDLLHPDDREYAMARTLESLRHPEAVIKAEVRLRHKDGTWRWIEATVSNLLTDSSVQALVKNYRDISERKQAEAALHEAQQELEGRVRARTAALAQANADLQATLADRERAEAALRESQAQLAGIIDSARDAIITIDEQQRILVFNAAAERLFQVAAADALGKPVQQFIPARSRPTHQAGLAEFARSNFEQWWVGMLGGATGLRRGGEEFPFEASISQVEVAGRKLFTISLHDVSAQRAAAAELRTSEKQLRALAARLQSVREEERARFAREVQDRLGQDLAVLKMDLAWVASKIRADDAPLADKLREMLALADAAIGAGRQIATDLRPGVLDDLGLVAALYWQAQEFQARTGIGCECLSDQPDIAVGPAASTALFRLCQEALTNVARHAQATRVAIQVGVEAGAVVLSVADDGRGITERELADPASLGLLGMRERARLLKGEVTIVGVPGSGTTVSVRIPLKVPNLQEVTENSGTPDATTRGIP